MDVVVDLRAAANIATTPAANVLHTEPAGKRWVCDVTVPRYGNEDRWARWSLEGYGCRLVGSASVSVLTATASDDTSTWTLVVLSDSSTDGAFALSWCRQTLPTLAAALVSTQQTRNRSATARRRRTLDEAYRTLRSLRAAFEDLDTWVGDPVPVRPEAGWSGQQWSSSATNLTAVVRWAAAGLGRLEFAAAFIERNWDPGCAYTLLREGLGRTDGFSEVVALLTGVDRFAGSSVLPLARVKPLLDQMHTCGFDAGDVEQWMGSPLAQWFFNSPTHAQDVLSRGWNKDALLVVAHQVRVSEKPYLFAVEMLLWERTMAVEEVARWADLVPLGLWVTSGASRSEVPQMLRQWLVENHGHADEAAVVEDLAERLRFLSSMSVMSEQEQALAAPHVSSTTVTRSPRGYPV